MMRPERLLVKVLRVYQQHSAASSVIEGFFRKLIIFQRTNPLQVGV
jgi:hypothetical protein